MKNATYLSAIAVLSSLGAIAGASAQSAEPGLDLEAIRARSKESSAEADALAASARERAERLTKDATNSAASAQSNGQRYARDARSSTNPDPAAPFDFDAMVADSGKMTIDGMGEAPRFIAFASTSMPPASLRQMFDDVSRAGGVIVLRGLPDNSAKALTAALARVAREGEQLENVGIDPRLFRAFNVTAVPAYIVTTSDFDLCDGFDCRTQVPPHDRMIGNVTVDHVLETFAGGGGPGALIAAQHLARLERSER